MVEDAAPQPSPIKTEPNPDDHTFIRKERTARCGNDLHDYDAFRFPACPGCGSLDRMMIEKVLSPEILHARLMRAIREGRKPRRKEE